MPTGRYQPRSRASPSLSCSRRSSSRGRWLPTPRARSRSLVLAAMLTALWEAGSRLARWLVPDFGPASRGVAAFTFAVGVAVVPATALGHFGWLRPAPFLIWTAAACLLSQLLPHPGERRRRERAPPRRLPRPLPSGIERVDLALLIMAGLAIALVGLYDMWRLRWAPAGPHGFDDISYHLSAVATWIRYGDLRMIRFSMGDPSTPFYPILGGDGVLGADRPLPRQRRGGALDADLLRRLLLSGGRRRSPAGWASRAGTPPSRRSPTPAIYHVFPVLSVSAGNDQSTSFFTLAGLDAALALARRPRPGTAVADRRRSRIAARHQVHRRPVRAGDPGRAGAGGLDRAAAAGAGGARAGADARRRRRAARPHDGRHRRLYVPAERGDDRQPDLPGAGRDPRHRDLPGVGRDHRRGARGRSRVRHRRLGVPDPAFEALRFLFPLHPAACGPAGAAFWPSGAAGGGRR